jgi:hypothetical protein
MTRGEQQTLTTRSQSAPDARLARVTIGAADRGARRALPRVVTRRHDSHESRIGSRPYATGHGASKRGHERCAPGRPHARPAVFLTGARPP